MKITLRYFIFISLFLGFFPLSCGIGDCNDLPFKIDLFEMDINLGGDGLLKGADEPLVIPQSEFFLNVTMHGDEHFVEQRNRELPSFGQYLMAIKECQGNYAIGFKVNIDSFALYCTSSIFGEPAGNALNDYFNVHFTTQNRMNQNLVFNFSDFNDSLRQNPELLISWWSTYTDPFKIKAVNFIDEGIYRFKIVAYLKDGTQIYQETDLIHFK